MDASSNALSCYYRTGYDFAVPLRHKMGFDNLTHLPPWEREYFITVKVRAAVSLGLSIDFSVLSWCVMLFVGGVVTYGE